MKEDARKNRLRKKRSDNRIAKRKYFKEKARKVTAKES